MYRIAFVTLSVVGAILLQGLFAIDGGLFAILKTILHGKFPYGRPMALVYSGLPVVDQFANIQVAFWYPVVSANGIPRLQACMLCASLQVAGVWAFVESVRRSNASRHWIISHAPLYVFLWQGIGTAIFLPLYFLVELDSSNRPSSDRISFQIPLSQAISLCPAAILSLAQPFALVFFPSSKMTIAQHQTALAIYQFGPFIGFALLTTFSSLLPKSTVESAKRNADVPWIKFTYALCAALCMATHVSCLYAAAYPWAGVQGDSVIFADTMSNPLSLQLGLTSLFVPSFDRVIAANADTLMTQASLFFLQWDHIICAVACAFYCDAVVRRIYPDTAREWSRILSLLMFLAACIIFGFGSVVSIVLLLREDVLRRFDHALNVDKFE